MIKILAVLLPFLIKVATSQLVPGMYCGSKNCYHVLDVEQDATRSEIAKSYRKLARTNHPDYLQSRGASKQEIEEKTKLFHSIATAYETLKDDEIRKEYDYYLQHPEEYYYNYYRYYKHQIPKVDVRLVLVGTISVISIFQYISWMTSYNTAINYMAHTAKYRSAAKQEAIARGLWLDKSEQRRQRKDKSREDMKQDEEDIIRKIIEEKMDIRGGYQKPEYTDVLWMQIILLPYTLYKFFSFHIHWCYNYTIKKKEFTDEAKVYLICKNLKIKSPQWDMYSDRNKHEFFNRHLWLKENADVYIAEKAEEAKIKMAEDPKMKRYRRWMNKGGPGRMTFEED